MNIVAELELFEAWTAEHAYNIDRTEMPPPMRFYVSVQTEGYWRTWQARAALSAPVLSDHDAFQTAVAIRELEWADVPYPTLVTKIRALLAKASQ